MAVKTDVKIPTPSVIEKPLIGPEPKQNKTTAAIKVVTFASIIDESAIS